MPPYTLLFDIDGTLADTDAIHFEAFADMMAAHGRPITLEDYRSSILGRANEAIFAELFPALTGEERKALADGKEAAFRARVATLEPTHGLLALLDLADSHGARLAAVTNAPRANAEKTLDVLGLMERLPTLVIAEELARGKPDPLPYLTGLEWTGGQAARALAFEDSQSGVTAAVRAGLRTYGVTTSLSAERLMAAGAQGGISSFADPRVLADIDALVKSAAQTQVLS